MFTAGEHNNNHQMLQYYPPPPHPHPHHQFDSLSLRNANAMMERKWKPEVVEIAPNCPRCASTNTKFCYYNNYSLSQPRYLCKGCRRYWTKGGSLRNVPVGGGCRKSRRSKSAQRVSENSSKSLNDQPISSVDGFGPNNNNGGSDIDLSVVFAKFLNEDSSSRETGLGNTSNSTSPDSVFGEANNLNIPEELIIPQVFEQQEEYHQRVQDLLEDDMSAYGLQDYLLSDDDIVYQDALWSQQAQAEAEAETLPNCTWQPMFHLQDFDFW